jgi:hypothetical protein
MRKEFRDKNGHYLEKGVLYDISSLSWPLSFQGYEYSLEGDFKNLEAVFWDFRGHPHYFNEYKTLALAVPVTPEKVREYMSSAKSLVEWLSIQKSKIAQTLPNRTGKPLEQRDEGPFGPHPFRKDDGFVHPHKRY